MNQHARCMSQNIVI